MGLLWVMSPHRNAGECPSAAAPTQVGWVRDHDPMAVIMQRIQVCCRFAI